MAEFSEVATRLKQYLKRCGVSVRAFEQRCGFSNGWVGNVKEQIRLDALLMIGRNYPDLNLNWLLAGRGGMVSGGDGARLPPERKDTAATEKSRPVSAYDIHHNDNVSINDIGKTLESIMAELHEMREERKQLLAIIDKLTK